MHANLPVVDLLIKVKLAVIYYTINNADGGWCILVYMGDTICNVEWPIVHQLITTLLHFVNEYDHYNTLCNRFCSLIEWSKVKISPPIWPIKFREIRLSIQVLLEKQRFEDWFGDLWNMACIITNIYTNKNVCLHISRIYM